MELKSPEVESEFKASVGDDGNVVLKRKSKIRRGAKSRADGGQFEVRVRKDLEDKGWVVDKWSNNIDFDAPLDKDNSRYRTGRGKIMPCKRKFNPFNKVMTIGTGFPDFVCFSRRENELFKVIGVEVKMNGNLSREEKEKCAWYLGKKIFNEILVASKKKIKNKVFVEYVDVGEIFGRMR